MYTHTHTHTHTHTQTHTPLAHTHIKSKVYNFYFTQTQTQTLAALNKIMIANIIKFETRGQRVRKTDLPGIGEELPLTDNTFLQWQARTKSPNHA